MEGDQTRDQVELLDVEAKLRQALQFLELSVSAADAGAFQFRLGQEGEPLADELTLTDVLLSLSERLLIFFSLPAMQAGIGLCFDRTSNDTGVHRTYGGVR